MGQLQAMHGVTLNPLKLRKGSSRILLKMSTFKWLRELFLSADKIRHNLQAKPSSSHGVRVVRRSLPAAGLHIYLIAELGTVY